MMLAPKNPRSLVLTTSMLLKRPSMVGGIMVSGPEPLSRMTQLTLLPFLRSRKTVSKADLPPPTTVTLDTFSIMPRFLPVSPE